MNTHYRTSKENKKVITDLTNKFNLGAENVIARVALAYSIENSERLELTKIKDSQGKEYSKNVLFGEHEDIYLGLISIKYDLAVVDPRIPKFIKLHLDDGLSRLSDYLNESNISSELNELLSLTQD